MGKKILKKMVVFVVAAALIISSGACVLAGTSSQVGVTKSVTSSQYFSKRSCTVKWAKVTNAIKYNVYVNGVLKKKGVKGTSCTITGIKAGTCYKITVKALAKNGKTLGKASTTKASTTNMRWMKYTYIRSVKRGSKKATVTWARAKKATGYQILYSKDGKTWKTKYVKGGTKNKVTIYKLTKGKWYFKIRPVRNGYLGCRSGAKTATVK